MLGRPEPREAAPYYSTYIDRVSGPDPLVATEAQLQEALRLFATIPEEKSRHRYAPEKWSVRQVLSHVNDTERAFAFRMLWFARGFDDPLPSFDQEIAAQGADGDGISWAAHVEEFHRIRLATISLFRHMPEPAWMRTGTAGGNSFTVRALAYIVPGHLAHHLAILQERYL